MKLKDIFNIKNVSNYIEGNAKRLYNDLFGLPNHIQEQVLFRFSKCSDDCLPAGGCKYCGCNPAGKLFVKESCNKGERFPDLMGEEEWVQYKKDNDIE